MLKAVLRGLPFRAGGGGGGGAFAGGGKEYATRSKAAANRRQQATTAKGVAATLLWMAFSSLLIIYNKRLYQAGFGFPMFVTGMGQVFSALGGWVLVTAGFLPLRPPPSPRFFLTALLPIVASTAATMFFGNYAYLYLSVAFIQILKAFTPAITLLLCVLFRIERFSKALFASVMLIALGTAGQGNKCFNSST